MMFELCIRKGRRVLFRRVNTLERCTELITYWINLPLCDYREYTYTLYPKDPDILQD